MLFAFPFEELNFIRNPIFAREIILAESTPTTLLHPTCTPMRCAKPLVPLNNHGHKQFFQGDNISTRIAC